VVRLALTHLTKHEQIRRCVKTTSEANECIDRRRFLVSFAGLVGIGALSPKLREARDGENELSVDFGLPGYLISDDFFGLSFETLSLLLDSIFLPENRSLISLVQRLSTKGVIRIGGNSSDRTSLRRRYPSTELVSNISLPFSRRLAGS
jgi:hypothetical protein